MFLVILLVAIVAIVFGIILYFFAICASLAPQPNSFYSKTRTRTRTRTIESAMSNKAKIIKKDKTNNNDIHTLQNKTNVWILFASRNVAKPFRIVRNQLERFSKKWKEHFPCSSCSILAFENDSNDDTVHLLESLKEIPTFDYIELYLCQQIPISLRPASERTGRLAWIRNQLWSKLCKHLKESLEKNYILMLDVDEITACSAWVDTFPFDQVEQEHQITWSFLSLGHPQYYDLWALRDPVYIVDDCWRHVNEPTCFQDKKLTWIQRKCKYVTNQALKIQERLKLGRSSNDPKKRFLPVSSAFGGATLYTWKREYLQLINPYKSEDSCKCEHVSFHTALHRLNPHPSWIDSHWITTEGHRG